MDNFTEKVSNLSGILSSMIDLVGTGSAHAESGEAEKQVERFVPTNIGIRSENLNPLVDEDDITRAIDKFNDWFPELDGLLTARVGGTKGGPGSGNWAHTSFQRVAVGRGGSDPKGMHGGGAIFAPEKYIQAIRRGIPKPARDAVEKAILGSRPGATKSEIAMYVDVMEMDKEKFDRYGNLIGLDVDKYRDDFFREGKAIEAEVYRRRWELRDSATHGIVTKEGKRLVHDHQFMGDDMYERVNKPVGNAAKDTAGLLKNEFDVEVVISRSVPEKEMHEQLSWIVNLGRESPVLATILRDKVQRIDFAPESGTAAMSWNPKNNSLLIRPGFHLPNEIVHELGHAASDQYLLGKQGSAFIDMNRIFGRGRMPSSYSWVLPTEAFAETFVAVVSGSTDVRDWAPEKWDFVVQNIPGMGE